MLCHRNFGGIYQVNITVVEDIAYLTLQAKYYSRTGSIQYFHFTGFALLNFPYLGYHNQPLYRLENKHLDLVF